jgi:hypothetical protein
MSKKKPVESAVKNVEPEALSPEEMAAREAEKEQIIATLEAKATAKPGPVPKKPTLATTEEPTPATKAGATTLAAQTAALATRAEAAALIAQADATERTKALTAKLGPLLAKVSSRRKALVALDKAHGADLASLAHKTWQDSPIEWAAPVRIAFEQKVCNRSRDLLADLRRGLATHTRLVEEAEGVIARGWQPGQAFQSEVEYLAWEMRVGEGLDKTLEEDLVVFSRDLTALIERGDRSATMPGPRSEVVNAGPKPVTEATASLPKQTDSAFDVFQA